MSDCDIGWQFDWKCNPIQNTIRLTYLLDIHEQYVAMLLLCCADILFLCFSFWILFTLAWVTFVAFDRIRLKSLGVSSNEIDGQMDLNWFLMSFLFLHKYWHFLRNSKIWSNIMTIQWISIWLKFPRQWLLLIHSIVSIFNDNMSN